MFVALSHCDKLKFSLLDWITATNKKVVFHTESLRQTKFVYLAKKLPKVSTMFNLFALPTYFCHFLGLLCLILHFFRTFLCVFLEFFGKIYQFCLLQWLSVTKKNSVCCSGSVPQTKIIFVAVTQHQSFSIVYLSD